MDVPAAHETAVRACRNLGRPGVAARAISALDIALWNLKARLLDVSLASLFGRAHEHVPVYGSGGFTTYDRARTVAQLTHFVQAPGAKMVKIKIGESWGPAVARDVERTTLAREPSVTTSSSSSAPAVPKAPSRRCGSAGPSRTTPAGAVPGHGMELLASPEDFRRS